MSRGERGRGPSFVARKMQAADTSLGETGQMETAKKANRHAYTELARQKRPRLCQPVSGQHHVRLGGDGLWQLQEHAGGLGQALGHVEYDILQVVGQRAQIVSPVQLLGSCQRVRHVCHLSSRLLLTKQDLTLPPSSVELA